MKAFSIIAFIALTASLSVPGAPENTLNIDEVPPEGVTQVWSPLFQATWDKLKTVREKELQQVVPPNPLITRLEAFQWQMKDVMPQDAFGVFAGPATEEFARETAASIKQQFNLEIDPSRVPTVPEGLAAYGILSRDLKFEKKFFRSRSNALEFQTNSGETHMVEFFGTAGSHSGNYGRYVKVLRYEPNAQSFILSIATDKEGEILIIYRPHQACSFRVAIEHVKKAMESPLAGSSGSLENGSLHRKDVVKIPYLTVHADTDFTAQLSGGLHYAGDPMPWRVVAAFQVTRFELFESGARMHVETGVGTEPFGEPPPVVPRFFVCDQPFFVFTWKAGADWPYFATWIDGIECLTPFPRD